ncbi:DUF5074 domain-containing protein [Parabacteroides bouchesdurhonensis]|uniref:DUF5074 domain-containing protein n=1 Tax=Parabacteroides bouchesdurhonensis TaxID=1936995 RepID=UPI000C81BC82|nr:DUF5074 domain-containing protein [Parabacteroides bouchesdurhonensis]
MKKNKFLFLSALCAMMAMFFVACDNDDDPTPDPTPDPEKTTAFYVLDGGSFGNNNAAISYVNGEGEVTNDIFKDLNGRNLGDMGQNMIRYGSKLYVSVYGSKTVEILNAADAKSLKQLKLLDEQGNERAPRMFAAHGDKVYLTTYDGYVAKIDTASMTVDAYVQVGPNPDGITIANGRIYTADTDGMNWPSQSTSVSVVDINTFKMEKTLTVSLNPNYIYSDSDGDVYVICMSDYSDDKSYIIQRIDAKTDEVTTIEGVKAYKMTVYDDIAYIMFNDYYAGAVKFYKYDLKNEKLLSDNFITDGTVIDSPNGIGIDPLRGDIYVAKSNKTNNGDVYVFTAEGKLKTQFETAPYPSDFVFMVDK